MCLEPPTATVRHVCTHVLRFGGSPHMHLRSQQKNARSWGKKNCETCVHPGLGVSGVPLTCTQKPQQNKVRGVRPQGTHICAFPGRGGLCCSKSFGTRRGQRTRRRRTLICSITYAHTGAKLTGRKVGREQIYTGTTFDSTVEALVGT